MTNATITALTPVSTVLESNDAIVTYQLSSALESFTTVKATVTPQGGATAADYGALYYHMGSTPTDLWLAVPTSGTGKDLITLNAGFTEFQLKVFVNYDTTTEPYDAIAFTVARTTSSAGLDDNSWWVPSLVNLQDATGTGTAILPRTITADPTHLLNVTGVEGGVVARANFHVSYDGPNDTTTNYSAAVVNVSMYGVGGATPADYANGSVLMYHFGTGGDAWSPVVNGSISIPNTETSFELSRAIKPNDGLSETGEGISFNVARTTNSVGLSDESWWVPNVVDIQDAAGTGASAYPRTITATSATPGTESAVDWVVTSPASKPAIATYHVSYDGAGNPSSDYADTTVHVNMYGLGGATPADWSGFMYRVGTSGAWTAVTSATIPINHTTTDFQLASYPVTDNTTETGEQISFNVAQTTSSVGIVESWSVQISVDLLDAVPANGVFTSGPGSDHFTPHSGVTDIFVIPAGKSLAQAGLFDVISSGMATGLTAGDVIAVGGAAGMITAYPGSYADESSLLANIALGTTGAPNARDVGYYAMGSDLYLVINTDGVATFSATDTLVKIVGAGSYTQADIAWFFA